MNIILETNQLTKNYDGKSALNRVSVAIKEGELVGVLGVNGAGKTTLLKLMSGLLEPTEGDIRTLGHDPWMDREKVLGEVGALIETPVFYEHLTAKQNMGIHLEYMEKSADVSNILKAVGLDSLNEKPVSKYSLGMKQRLAIARCISHKPKVLFLDEPINGLDPIAIKDMRALFLKLKSEGVTIVVSSHILSELLQTVESLVVICDGRLEQLGYIDDLKKMHGDNLENYLIERMRG